MCVHWQHEIRTAVTLILVDSRLNTKTQGYVKCVVFNVAVTTALSYLVAVEITCPGNRRLLQTPPDAPTPILRFYEERDDLCFQYWPLVALKSGLVFIDPNLLRPKPQVTDHLIPNMRHEGEWPRVVLARLGIEAGSFASLVSEGQESLP